MIKADTALMDAVGVLMREVSQRALLPRFSLGRQIASVEKEPGEPVTVADRECEAMIGKGLSRLLPEAAILGEEAVAADPSLLDKAGDALCWVIDPLDGTANFARGDPAFGMMIALAEHGTPIAGWMLAPMTGRLCKAVRGGGAWINESQVWLGSSGGRRRLGISSLFGTPEKRASLKRQFAAGWEAVPLERCAAEVYPRIALGGLEAALFGRTLPWDHAAGQLFINEAGGMARRLDGSDYRIDDARDGLLAADPSLWQDLANRAAACCA